MKIRSYLFACVLCASTTAIADPMPPSTTTQPSAETTKLSDVDQQVVAHLHAVDQYEIAVGKIAERNATPAVKSYGQMLVRDHTAFDTKLAAFAKRHGLETMPPDDSLSTAMKADHDTEKGKLSRLNGAAFDQELLPMVAAAHDQELVKLDANMAIVNDAGLKALLEGVKPVLQKHADEARRLETPAMRSST